MDRMMSEAVEKQISASYQTSLQALNMEMARQIGDCLAESEDRRAALESMAKKLFEEQTELLRVAGVQAEKDLDTRAATILRSVEESLAQTEARIDAARAHTEGVLSKAQSLKQEAMDTALSLQAALQQLNNAEKAGIEKLYSQVAAQLVMRAAQFENELNKISTDRAVQFSVEMEKHMDPHRQRADEAAEKLGAMLQLLQGTARAQQERLTEHSRTTAASFEKEIRAVLLRFADST